MFRPSRKLFDLASQSGLISHSDKEIYQFGFEVTLLKCAHIITMLLIGLAFHMLAEAVLFLVAYSSLRIYAGGYHSKSKIRCYIISCLMMSTVLFIAKHQQQLNPLFFLSAAFVSMCIIILLSPVENKNNPLDDTEKTHYKKRTYIIGLVQFLFLVLFFFLRLYTYLIILCLSICILSLMLIIGYFQARVKG